MLFYKCKYSIEGIKEDADKATSIKGATLPGQYLTFKESGNPNDDLVKWKTLQVTTEYISEEESRILEEERVKEEMKKKEEE